jgi:hypothetical protein
MPEDTGSESLDALEPMEELDQLDEQVSQQGPSLDHFIAHRLMAGAQAPAFNPEAHKEYYRFLFAGVLVLVGCLMPFGPQPVPGYYSITGGAMLIIAIGLAWSMWGAINTGKFRMKWVLLMFFPFVWSLMHLMKPAEEPAVAEWIAAAHRAGNASETVVEGWGEFFKTLVARSDLNRGAKCSAFIQHLGAGKVMVFLGSLLAEFYFLAGLFGGIKKAREKKGAAVASRRRGRDELSPA